MRRLTGPMVLGILATALPVAALAAMPRTVHLMPTSAFKAKGGFKHVTATAHLRYAKAEVSISLQTKSLPSTAALGEKVYVAYASDGSMTDRIGALTHGAMASVRGQLKMARIQDLYVYAERSATPHPRGKRVLAAMVG